MKSEAAKAPAVSHEQTVPLVLLVSLSGILIWSYWNTIAAIMDNWQRPMYSHGYLIPLFSVVLLYLRFEPIGDAPMWQRWTGVALLALGLLGRLVASYFALIIGDMATLILCLLGIFLIVGGTSALRWSWPAIAFLAFCLPLPDFVERGMLDPLQNVATRASTFALQTIGMPAYSEGNSIRFSSNQEVNLGVVDACSGLRMMTIFAAMSAAVVLVIPLTWWEKVIVLASAVPIALAVNVTRITVTGVMHMTVGRELADRVFHDLAGWVMMPLAFGLLYVELQILSNLFIDSEDAAETVRGTLHQPAR